MKGLILISTVAFSLASFAASASEAPSESVCSLTHLKLVADKEGLDPAGALAKECIGKGYTAAKAFFAEGYDAGKEGAVSGYDKAKELAKDGLRQGQGRRCRRCRRSLERTQGSRVFCERVAFWFQEIIIGESTRKTSAVS